MIVGELLEFTGREVFPHVLAHLMVDTGVGQLRRMHRRQRRASPATAVHALVAAPSVRGATVLSHVPGRIRLAVPGLHGDAARAIALEETLRRLPGVISASTSPCTGNALVYYEAGAITVVQFEALLAACNGCAGFRTSGAPERVQGALATD